MGSGNNSQQQPGRRAVRRRFPWGWTVVLVLAASAVVAGVAASRMPQPMAVTRPVLLKAGEREPLVTAAGYLVARHRATLSAKVPGRLAWLGVEEGTRVRQGQVIARLESADLQASREQTAASLQQAELDLARGEKLAAQGVLDRASLDRLRSAAQVLRAQLRYQDAQLENMVLRAPFTGTVTQKLSEVGETVSPGSAGGANAINAVAVLADFDSLEVEVEVSENGIAKLRKGMPAEIRVDALDGDAEARVLPGELREIYPTSNRQKAVVVVRVAFRKRHPILVPDMGAKVTFLGQPAPADALLLGREQVVRVQGRPHVWVLRQGTAQLQPIEIVRENATGLEVKGLDPEAQLLVVLPDMKLKAGQRVAVKER